MHQGTVGGVQSGDHLAVAQVDTNVAVAVLEDDVAGLGVRGGAARPSLRRCKRSA